MSHSYEEMEKRLDSFNAEERQAVLDAFIELASMNEISLPAMGNEFNLHCHSFYSFNGYGWSPTGLAWRGRMRGLCGMGLVDFDVLDGVDEFLNACALLGLRAGAGLETRVFVPEFSNDEINSPGEPGVAYQIGMGFVSTQVRGGGMLKRLKEIAQNRTRTVVERVNTLLTEIALDYAGDVLPLTPNNNPTERHVCAAYDARAREVFRDSNALTAYWANKLGFPDEAVANALSTPPVFQGMVRAKTMKSGGVGYILPKSDEFPLLQEVNRFVLDNGAIPVFAFLDGTTSGEMRMEELLDVMTASGVAAVNIIPDRNWNIANAEVKSRKLQNLDGFIRQARARQLPIFVGTEMNAYGQPFVDNFFTDELAPYFEDFREGMYLLHGHTALQAQAAMGYLSPWAESVFDSIKAKNRFYVQLGKKIEQRQVEQLSAIEPDTAPETILAALR